MLPLLFYSSVMMFNCLIWPIISLKTSMSKRLYEADETDDGAEAADVIFGKQEGFVYSAIFGDAEDAIIVLLTLHHTLDEDAL